MRLTDSAHMRDADNTAIQARGIPSTLLMTNAAGHVARAALELKREGPAFAFCGSGNNGGDGVAAAVYLMRRGLPCRVLLTGSRASMTADTREMERRLLELGGSIEDFDPEDKRLPGQLQGAGVIIDAMFGVGLNRPLRERALRAVQMINASGAPVVSADIASGVEADTGRVLGDAVRATKTVTFSMAKPGHFAEPGCVRRGELEIADIGIPADILRSAGVDVFAVTERDVSLPKRPAVSHKGDYGRLMVVGGCADYVGAPSLCAWAALRSGAGLVYLGVPSDIFTVTALKNDCAMPFSLASDGNGRLNIAALPVILSRGAGCGAWVLGPGLGRSEELAELVRALILAAACPLVLDADALFAVGDDAALLKSAAASLVLTPHEGEFLRLGGKLTGDRVSDARSFAVERGCILVLKGHRTVCAFPDGKVYINTTGNPGMAKGGSGDALAGTIGALIGQLPLKQAVITAVWLHSRAGDICAERLGEYGMTPVDIINTLPEAEREIVR